MIGRALVGAAAFSLGAWGCMPRVPPLPGAPAPARLPRGRLPGGYHRIVFTWQYDDADMTARGEGVARLAAPDSVRLDLFLEGGFGSAVAYLIGETISAPGGGLVRRLLPPAPLAWAALGRLDVPPLPDTVVRLDGATLRADIGRDRRWRVAFVGDSLVSLQRLDGDRLAESVTRAERGVVRYANPAAHRVLALTILRTDSVGVFDASVWHR